MPVDVSFYSICIHVYNLVLMSTLIYSADGEPIEISHPFCIKHMRQKYQWSSFVQTSLIQQISWAMHEQLMMWGGGENQRSHMDVLPCWQLWDSLHKSNWLTGHNHLSPMLRVSLALPQCLFDVQKATCLLLTTYLKVALDPEAEILGLAL